MHGAIEHQLNVTNAMVASMAATLPSLSSSPLFAPCKVVSLRGFACVPPTRCTERLRTFKFQHAARRRHFQPATAQWTANGWVEDDASSSPGQQVRRALGLDYGRRVVGLAVSTQGLAPRPLEGLPGPAAHEQLQLAATVLEVAARESCDAVVVGLPVTERGNLRQASTDSQQGRRCRNFAGNLAAVAEARGVRVFLADERGSTLEARAVLASRGSKKSAYSKVGAEGRGKGGICALLKDLRGGARCPPHATHAGGHAACCACKSPDAHSPPPFRDPACRGRTVWQRQSSCPPSLTLRAQRCSSSPGAPKQLLLEALGKPSSSLLGSRRRSSRSMASSRRQRRGRSSRGALRSCRHDGRPSLPVVARLTFLRSAHLTHLQCGNRSNKGTVCAFWNDSTTDRMDLIQACVG